MSKKKKLYAPLVFKYRDGRPIRTIGLQYFETKDLSNWIKPKAWWCVSDPTEGYEVMKWDVIEINQ